METFKQKTFNLENLNGISKNNIEEHLKLYAGYVKNANSILEKIPQYESYVAEDAFAPYVVSELERRFSFEYNGMRNHEVYFDLLSDGAKAISTESELNALINKQFGSVEKFIENFKALAMTRGVGWAVLWYDKKEDKLLTSWVDEQHLGQLNGCDMIIACDMWEHAYVYDFPTSKKKDYIEAFFANLNWSKAEENLKKAK